MSTQGARAEPAAGAAVGPVEAGWGVSQGKGLKKSIITLDFPQPKTNSGDSLPKTFFFGRIPQPVKPCESPGQRWTGLIGFSGET